MLSLRNYQAQGPDSQFFPLMEEEEISQNLHPLLAGEGRDEGLSAHPRRYEYFFVRRVGAVFAGSSGQTCFG